jgi:von Willebrand factor type A domain
LNLLVNDLPSFHLQFQNRNQLEVWKRALLDVHNPEPPLRSPQDYDQEFSGPDEDDFAKAAKTGQRVSSTASSQGLSRSVRTAPTDYAPSVRTGREHHVPPSLHVPIDLVVVIPISSSMQGLKISLLRDTLRFLVQNLGERDRMGLVTFGSSGGGVPLVGMTTKAWTGWNKTLASIRPVGQKSLRADVVEGANVAMDLLMQRKAANPISTILLISDSSTSDAENVDFVIQRAEAAKCVTPAVCQECCPELTVFRVTIHSFGLGLTHKPDTMIDLSSRTKASYMYVKDWMMLRECVAGCLGSLQTISHQNVKLKLRLPEGSPAKFVKISGALQITKRATGKDAEAALGDFRFGDKRDILVQLAIAPDSSSQEHLPQDPWETIVSGLEALGGPLDSDEQRTLSIEELPLLQADVTFGDILRDGTLTQLPRPTLLAITMLPGSHKSKQNGRPLTPPIPPHPSIVQRRMELLTSDMLSRALSLVSRGLHERAHHLLHETRTILKGLAKGGLPPIPTSNAKSHSDPNSVNGAPSSPHSATPERQPSPHSEGSTLGPGSGVDSSIMAALDGDIESSLEWISHPAVFSRDSRKAVLQSIGVISSQRGYTFRTPAEAIWAGRISGIKRVTERAREWRDSGDDGALTEE